MNFLSLLLWVTQFGLSALFPLSSFLLLAAWLRQRFGLGMWIFIPLGILGFLISVSTVKANMKTLLKDVQNNGSQKPPPTSFNNHK